MTPAWLAVFLPILSAIVGATVGGLVVHRGASLRDARNEQRGRRVEHLVSAYQRLSAVSNRTIGDNEEQNSQLEDAVSDIMLLGQKPEVDAARQFIVSFAQDGSANLDPLLIALRDSLRNELHLDKTSLPHPYSLRISSRPSEVSNSRM